MEYEKMLEGLLALGCDVPGALNRMMQDRVFYHECLVSFAADPLIDQLGNALQSGEIEQAFEYAHALKGVSANLGLTPLRTSAAEIVRLHRLGVFDGMDALFSEIVSFRASLLLYL